MLNDNGLSFTESTETIILNGTYGSFIFLGRGRGCGVGLSIYGALSLAERGFNCNEILECYFPGAVLTKKASE